jgi:hypothetical protein
MAGLFDSIGNGLKGLFGDGFADRAAIAGALIEGDYGGAASIRAAQARRQLEQQKAAQQQQMQIAAYQAAKGMGMSDDQALAIAGDPSVAASFIADRMKIQQFGAAGGSTYDPATHETRMAPSRHEYQGSVFDVGGGPAGQSSPVTVQHEGTQWITPQPGTTAFGVNSFTGRPRGQSSPPMSEGKSGPKPGTVEDGYMFKGGNPADPSNWEKVGGQSQSGSGGFPF